MGDLIDYDDLSSEALLAVIKELLKDKERVDHISYGGHISGRVTSSGFKWCVGDEEITDFREAIDKDIERQRSGSLGAKAPR